MKSPIVAILTPYLPDVRANWFARAKASVQAQTYPHVVHLFWQDTPQAGIPTALNNLLERHHAGIDAWWCLGADDYLPPDAVAECVAAWEAADRKPDLVFGKIGGCDVWGNEWVMEGPTPWVFSRERVLQGFPVLPSAALHPIRLWHSVGPYDTELRHGREDQAWFVTACARHPEFQPLRIPAVTYYHRQRSGSLTSELKFHEAEWLVGLKRARRNGEARRYEQAPT